MNPPSKLPTPVPAKNESMTLSRSSIPIFKPLGKSDKPTSSPGIPKPGSISTGLPKPGSISSELPKPGSMSTGLPKPGSISSELPKPGGPKIVPPAPELQKIEAPAPEPQKIEAPAPEPQKIEAPAPEPQKIEAPAPEPQKIEPPAPEPQKIAPPAPEPQKISPSSSSSIRSAVADSTSNPSMQLSNPSLLISDPSIRATKQNQRLSRILMLLLVLIALVALVTSTILAIKQFKADEMDAKARYNAAWAVKHVNPVRFQDTLTSLEEETAVPEDKIIYLSVSSVPTGANVYLDGNFIGTTNEQGMIEKKLHAQEGEGRLILALDGYQIARKSFSLENDFSETIILEPIPEPVIEAPRVVEKTTEKDNAVVENKAVVIGGQSSTGTSKKSKKKSEAKAQEVQFVLPD